MTDREREMEQAEKDYWEREDKKRRIEESYDSDEFLARMGSENALARLSAKDFEPEYISEEEYAKQEFSDNLNPYGVSPWDVI